MHWFLVPGSPVLASPLAYSMTSTGSPESQHNQAFQVALQRHLDKWESDCAFPESVALEELYSEIKQHVDDRRRSRLHGCTSRISDVIKQFETFFGLVDKLVSMNPIAGLVWGGIRFIMRVREFPMHIS